VSSDETSTENEALKSKPPKKELKFSVPKDKEIDGNLWTTHFSKQFVPKIPLQAPNAGAVLNFVAWRDG